MGLMDKMKGAAKDAMEQAKDSADVMMNRGEVAPAPVAGPQVAPVQTTVSGATPEYVVLQVTLKEKLIGTGSGNLSQLEKVINEQARKGYRLHTITSASAHSGGFAGGDRIQATLVFEKL